MANIVFEKIRIHNFLSFGDAELDFREKGYVLVSGINKNPKDGALSNGSGKSSIWSAISWALTGQTVQGLSSNIINLNFLDEGCWVELTFNVDDDKYVVTRSRDFGKKGPNLKIFINDIDKSGDGVKKSEAILAEYLPDLSSTLLGSVIILGQGLPHRFTNNTPAGRKEVLENLSKSDFMIEDIKRRITARKDILSTESRNLEDTLLQVTTQIDLYTKQLEQEKNKLVSYQITPNFDNDIIDRQIKINELDTSLNAIVDRLSQYEKEQAELNETLITSANQKAKEIELIKDTYNTKVYKSQALNSQLTNEKNNLLSEITKLESIKDVCPTCGQKLPHVHKQDTTAQRLRVDELSSQLEELREQDTQERAIYAQASGEIDSKYYALEQTTRGALVTSRTESDKLKREQYTFTQDKNRLSTEILQLQNSKATFEATKRQIEETIHSLENSLKLKDEEILYNNKERFILDAHILSVDKMNTLVKRDFRGFLLTNVIEYINARAKIYCSDLFETDEIDFRLDGNNIDISFCDKAYENLSGGEKQKVDIIVQFSIRDMLCQYLNFSSNILVLDEITDNLDVKGSEKIINLISTKLTDIESVFIITHHTELFSGLFENEIVVEKDERGVSRII